MIVPSLFGNELSNLPQAQQASQTPTYGPEYFNQIENYYSGYLPGQSLDTSALADWYKSSKNIPFGGTSFAPAPIMPATGAVGGSIGMDSGSGGSDMGPTNENLDDAGLAQAFNVDPRAIQGIGLLGSILGIPFSGLLGMFKDPISGFLTKQSYDSAVAKNTALVAAQLGLDPKDPANAAAISAAIDSQSATNQGTTAATTGPTGTGGAASSAASQAAANAAALGFGDAAIGAAAQAAANAALAGATQAAQAQAGIEAAIAANNVAAETQPAPAPSQNYSYPGNDSMDFGGPPAGQTSADTGVGNPGESASESSSKIVCTAMNQEYGFGSFRNAIWLKYAERKLTKAHEVGYHTIFLPLVNFGFKKGDGKLNLMVRKFLESCARHRSLDLRAEMRNTKRDSIGRAYRFVLEPLCYLVGKFKGY